MTSSGDSLKAPFLGEYIVMEEEEGSNEDASDDSGSVKNMNRTMLREQDRFLPICNIIKIMKVTIPDNGKIAKDARECIQECVSEFISFVTSEAIDRSHNENRKTVNGDDLLYAFLALGFDNYVAPLSIYLNKYRETTKSDRNLVYPMLFDDDEEFSGPSQNGLDTPIILDTSHNRSQDQGCTSNTAADNDTSSIMFYQPNQSGNFNL